MFQMLGLAVCVGLGGPTANEPPADREVLRALPQVKGVPYIFEAYRDDMTIVKERVAAKEVKLGVFGLNTTVVSAHWKCDVFYTETVESSVPFPLKVAKKRVQVVYIDTVDAKK